MNTIFARGIGAFGSKITQTPMAMLSRAAPHAQGQFATHLTPVRQFQDLRTLLIPGPLPEQAIGFYGKSALSKVGLTIDAIRHSEDGWDAGIARLNESAAKDLPLSRQFRLTRTDCTALTLAFIQAGTRLRLDFNSTAFVSLAYNLLASFPVEAGVLARFDQYARKLANDIIPYTDLLSESIHWPDLAPDLRLEVMRDVYGKMYPLAQDNNLAPGCQDTLTLEWDGDLYNSPIAAGFFLVAIDARGLQVDPGRVRLSRHLIEDDLDSFGKGCGNQAELAIVAPALSVAVLSHEIFHAWQYSRLETLANTPTPDVRDVRNALSIGCQSVIASRNLGTLAPDHHGSESRLLPHLPHEKEAWALTFMVVRSLYQSICVPERYKPGLKNYLLNNFDVFARCVGGAPPPRPSLPSGELWERSGELCVETQDFNSAWKEAEITEFLSNGEARKSTSSRATSVGVRISMT